MDESLNLQAVVLAGGRGSRLQSVVSDRPKVLAEVGGKPFLDWLLAGLARQGVEHFILCTGYLESAVRECIGDGRRLGIHVSYSSDPTPLGTGGALRNAVSHIQSDPVLIVNGDTWCDFNLEDFLRFHRANLSPGSILLAPVNNRSRYGSVSLDAAYRLTHFQEKCGMEGGWISAGIYLLSTRLITAIPAGQNISLEQEVFPGNLSSGLTGWPGGGAFVDIGTPESLAAAHDFFSAKSRS